ncbi:hypothetical protein IGI04_005453 [Brassica rapa subsp. trilocularis]|uniref:18S rRNA (guanine(1575)-N(7))-methyltransferase Bud23 C-terminal domain-containing protein n=1 Tax=Brassica rapa subsp. trilocularis TaxID=1813537 RepID=A0ABQ7NE18_BRACM|nr:18S rRNA (guanine-N(7))-methyltransferase RID2-like [Brassica rapa]KAG5409134.1 hypothetical protein IGI04_005453 [Brassica rapa subsp. trilocularis]
MGQCLGLRAGVLDGAISISAVQWLGNADKSWHEPRLRLKYAFFGSLYRCLSRGARAVFQIYPENLAQRELIFCQAMKAGFSGWFVLDYAHSTKSSWSSHVVLFQLILTMVIKIVALMMMMIENGMVWVSDRNRPRKLQRTNKNGKERDWVLRKKEQSRRKGNDVPADSKYTARKRKSRF